VSASINEKHQVNQVLISGKSCNENSLNLTQLHINWLKLYQRLFNDTASDDKELRRDIRAATNGKLGGTK